MIGVEEQELSEENLRLEQENRGLREENIRLRREAHYYKELHARCQDKLKDSEGINQALKEKVADLNRRLFGRKSEKSKPDPAAGTSASKEKKPRGQRQGGRGHGRKKRDDLPEQTQLVKWAGEEPTCAQCGRPYRHNGTARSHEEIVWEVRLYKRVIRRQRYEQGCTCSRPGWPEVLTAPAPAQLIPGGLLSIESIVEGLLRKFDSWMPLERITREWRELGVPISPGTWCGIWQRLVPLFEPLVQELEKVAQQSGQWLMDETRWKVFVLVEGKGSHRWWIWVLVSPKVKLYILSDSRSARVPKKFFGYDAKTKQCQCKGFLMVDRYSSYKFLADLLLLAFCWSHYPNYVFIQSELTKPSQTRRFQHVLLQIKSPDRTGCVVLRSSTTGVRSTPFTREITDGSVLNCLRAKNTAAFNTTFIWSKTLRRPWQHWEKVNRSG